jgi:hypothetical protein
MDILNLSNSMGERAIRWLYTIALILITLGVVFGVWRGGVTMMRTPMPRLPISADANTGAPAPQATAPDANAPVAAAPQRGPGMRGMQPGMRGRFDRRRGGMMGMRMMRRNPQMFGGLMIIRALLRGLIALLVVRVLAEIGLRQLRRA